MKTDELIYEIRDKESFRHACEISKPFGALDAVIDWCRSEMVDTWRWQLIQTSTDHSPGRYIFYFDSDRDCCAFLLKWKD